jgi:hypothetical protein
MSDTRQGVILEKGAPSPPACPHCRRGMKLIRSIPMIGTTPELRLYSCSSCEEIETVELT